MGKYPGYWSIFSRIQSYMYVHTAVHILKRSKMAFPLNKKSASLIGTFSSVRKMYLEHVRFRQLV